MGYYVPGSDPKTNSGNTLILAHKNVHVPAISDKMLLDDVIYEVDWDGDIVWEWKVSDHFEELGFDAIARNLMYRDPNYYTGFGNSHIAGDWVHTNSMSVLGPNKWYDAGDKRFHPDNIIIDCRDANIILIIEKATGNIVWKIGPYFDQTPELRKLGWIIGQHHAHMIPRGLPGEGNILIYDNGGWAGYYAPNPGSPTGIRGALRDYSRVLEIDPVTLEIVWQMTPKEAGYLMPLDANRFYSPFISGMQRLPNGNTMITEGSHGRIFEVTPEHELVWEYVCPYWGTALPMNMVYRSYRLPYEWVPQLEKPAESPIERLDVSTFRVPGAAAPGVKSAVKIKEAKGYFGLSATCVAADIEEEAQDEGWLRAVLVEKGIFPIRAAFLVRPRLRRGDLSVRLGDGALLFEEARETHEEAVLTLFDVGDALWGGGDRRSRRDQGQRHMGDSVRMEQRRSAERAE